MKRIFKNIILMAILSLNLISCSNVKGYSEEFYYVSYTFWYKFMKIKNDNIYFVSSGETIYDNKTTLKTLKNELDGKKYIYAYMWGVHDIEEPELPSGYFYDYKHFIYGIVDSKREIDYSINLNNAEYIFTLTDIKAW